MLSTQTTQAGLGCKKYDQDDVRTGCSCIIKEQMPFFSHRPGACGFLVVSETEDHEKCSFPQLGQWLNPPGAAGTSLFR